MTAAILDHLWQSTLIVLGVMVLVAALNKASAAVRHGLWLAASVKFLVPFAALAALGRLLAPAIRLPAPSAPQAAVLAKAAQPFADVSLPEVALPVAPIAPPPLSEIPLSQVPLAQAPALSPAEALAPVAHAAPHAAAIPHISVALILLAAWALGSAAILARWAMRWIRLRQVVRAAAPIGWPAPMPVLASPSLIEPGLFGLVRPVLIVPQTLPDHLSRSEIDAIVAHEAWHLRRRDNLTGALHMLVEALFWFHPLVWWIGGRLIAEREGACDEAVVRAGHDRAAYARSLVESCRHYLQSPLDCVAGASGSNLKTRVEAIMTAPLASPLSRPKKALLLAAGACAVATPVMAGLMTPQAQRAVAPVARAMAALASPARALQPLTQDDAVKPVVLARNDAILAPSAAVTATDAQPMILWRNPPGPRVELAQLQPTPATEDAGAGPIGIIADTASRNDDAHTMLYVGNVVVTGDLKKVRLVVDGRPAPADFDPAGKAFAAATVHTQTAAPGSRFIEEIDFQTHAPAPSAHATENAVRHWILALQTHQFAVVDMTPAVEESARQQWNLTVQMFHAFGGLKALTFQRVTPDGDDAYEADFAHGKIRVMVGPLTADGKLARLAWSPIWDQDLRGDAVRQATPQATGVEPPTYRWGPGGVGPAPFAPVVSRGLPAAAPLLRLASFSSPVSPGQTSDFVRANARVGQFGYTVRWEDPLCLDIEGLTPEQNAAIASRINAVAQTLSQKVYSGLHQSCAQKNVWVVFTNEPQRMLDSWLAVNPRVIGDAHSDTRGITTVTQPVQAWRETVCIWEACEPEPFLKPSLFARVLVDARRVDGDKLNVIADYLAMLVLADPRATGQCQVLPSVLDLFAGACPGRSEPTGLTRTDLAYLKALYTAGSPITQRDWNWSEHGGSVDQIAGRMGMLLAGAGDFPAPGAKPERHD
jgi:beta-lactamase regulating signal transducer with metallopeptidase domain